MNIAICGHVDAGKTSLAKVLSTIQSTACFDKHPESQRRGITIDVGISGFTHNNRQYCFIDCPGHAGFIKSIICGMYIADIVLLVIDSQKLLQVQTHEVLALIKTLKLQCVIVLSKSNGLSNEQQQQIEQKVLQQVERYKIKLVRNFNSFSHEKLTTDQQNFSQNSQNVVFYDINVPSSVLKVKEVLINLPIPDRKSYTENQDTIIHYDHCFHKKGIGLVLTGTIKQGHIAKGQNLYLCFQTHESKQSENVNNIQEKQPSNNQSKAINPDKGNKSETNCKIVSLQSFHESVENAQAGDRVGINIRLDYELNNIAERGIIVTKKSQLLKSKYFLCKLTNFKQGEELTQNVFQTASFGYQTVNVRLSFFDEKEFLDKSNEVEISSYDLGEQVKNSNVSQKISVKIMNYNKKIQFKQTYAIISAQEDVINGVLEKQQFIILRQLQSNKEIRIAMSGTLIKPVNEKDLQYYKRKMQHKIPVEISKVKSDDQMFSISIPMLSNTNKEKCKFQSLDEFIGCQIVEQSGKTIGKVLQRFGQEKLKCEGLVNGNEKYFVLKEKLEPWPFPE